MQAALNCRESQASERTERKNPPTMTTMPIRPPKRAASAARAGQFGPSLSASAHPWKSVVDFANPGGESADSMKFLLGKCNLRGGAYVNLIKTTRGGRKRPPRSNRPLASYPFNIH